MQHVFRVGHAQRAELYFTRDESSNDSSIVFTILPPSFFVINLIALALAIYAPMIYTALSNGYVRIQNIMHKAV
jgi:hypothetical protein